MENLEKMRGPNNKSKNNLRKNILINSDDFNRVNIYAKKVGISFSEIVRTATLKYVEEQENLDLAAFLRANCPSVPENEEYEIIEALNNLDEDDLGEEISLERFLQGSL